MTDICHRFEYAEDDEYGGRKVVLTTIFTPEPWDYILALLRRRPWPKASEHQTEFYSKFSTWFEANSDIRCSAEMSELLDYFYETSYYNPGSRLVGKT